MTTVYLVRHAEAEGNLYRRVHGQYDSLVTPNGQRQIAALRLRFQGLQLDACYTSDLIRTRLTAQALTVPRGMRAIPDPRLRELNLGRWEDETFGWVSRTEPGAMEQFDRDPVHWHTPGAERYADGNARFLQALGEAARAHNGGTIAVVSHGSVIRNALMELVFGADHPSAAGHSDNTAVSCLEYDAGQWRLRFVNDASHLDASISTFAKQNWWREGAEPDRNLWFEPWDAAPEPYRAMRREAWICIYGTEEGLDADGFYEELCGMRRYHPNAAAYARWGDETVGFIQLAPARRRDRGVGYVSFVYLLPEYRGKGLGAQLIGYAVSTYRAMGRRALQLGVAQENRRAQRFYEKLGFHAVGTTPGLQRDLILMQLEIDRAPYALK